MKKNSRMAKPAGQEITNSEGDQNSLLHSTKERHYLLMIIDSKIKK
jgi:hypothetical protein